MKETRISLPELMLVAGTRAALGAGLGLLVADRLSEEQRKAVGWSLFLFGVLSTIPLVLEVFGGQRLSSSERQMEQAAIEPRSDSGRRQNRRGALART